METNQGFNTAEALAAYTKDKTGQLAGLEGLPNGETLNWKIFEDVRQETEYGPQTYQKEVNVTFHPVQVEALVHKARWAVITELRGVGVELWHH